MSIAFLEREIMLLGEELVTKITNKKVIVFGCGGVGGACVEALARTGVGHIALVDGDTVSLSNKNRQIIALDSTMNRPKTEVLKERILDINPCATVETYQLFYIDETYDLIDLKQYDYVIDCIDTVTAKLHLIEECYKQNIPLISSTGTGNRMDPTKFYITDIFNTTYDPLAKVLRQELRKRKIKKLTVLASKEQPFKVPDERKIQDPISKRNIPASIAFAPPVAGYIIASYVFKELIK